MREHYIGGVLRARWDTSTTPRIYREWNASGALVVERPFHPHEDEAADEDATAARRDARLATLLDRAETAQQGNRDSLPTLANISGAAAFNNAQRDSALRFLAERVEVLTRQNNALMQLTLRLAGRVAALDAPD